MTTYILTTWIIITLLISYTHAHYARYGYLHTLCFTLPLTALSYSFFILYLDCNWFNWSYAILNTISIPLLAAFALILHSSNKPPMATPTDTPTPRTCHLSHLDRIENIDYDLCQPTEITDEDYQPLPETPAHHWV